MTTRITFDRELLHAIHLRGLTLGAVAKLAGISPGTVTAAIHGHAVNMSTATRLARAVSSCPVIPELEAWLVGPNAAPPTEPKP